MTIPNETGRYFTMNAHPVHGYTMFSYFSFRDGQYRPGQCQACPTKDVAANQAYLESHGWTRAIAFMGPKGWELREDV